MEHSYSSWIHSPSARRAAVEHRYGILIRIARVAAGLTLEQAGRLTGYSASTLSRMESGQRQLTDITVLRRLAAALGIPTEMFGLIDVSSDLPTGPLARLPQSQSSGWQADGDDPVHRRTLLGGLAGISLSPAVEPDPAEASDPGRQLVAGLENVLLHGPPTQQPATPTDVKQGLLRARADFQASRYSSLADRLPQLLASAERDAAADPALLAEIYNTAVHVLIKLGKHGLSWLAADRAIAHARSSGDPIAVASVTRNVVTLCRKEERFDTAERLALQAAEHLEQPSRVALSLLGMLLCNAGYAAAQHGDRARAGELLDEAATAANRLGEGGNAYWTAFGPTNVLLHRISAASALGDFGKAISYARLVDAGTLRLPERCARYWVDVANAWLGWGKPVDGYRALTIAEQVAPEEVRARPVVRKLAGELLSAPSRPGLSGIRGLAARVGVPEAGPTALR